MVLIDKTKLLSKAFENINDCIAKSFNENLFADAKQ